MHSCASHPGARRKMMTNRLHLATSLPAHQLQVLLFEVADTLARVISCLELTMEYTRVLLTVMHS